MTSTSSPQVSFTCKAPDGAETIRIDGLHAYDAASHCAKITAAKRLAGSKDDSQRVMQELITAAGGTGLLSIDETSRSGFS